VTEFWIVAGLMALLAVAFIAWPVWRHYDRHGGWNATAILAAVLVVPAAVGLYLKVSTWQPGDAPRQANSEQLAIVEQLAARMQETPDDVEGWRLLGRSYLTLQEFPAARHAFMQAWQRTPNPDNELKLDLGISMIHSDRASIGSDGGQLIEDVLESEPNNQQALWYGGLVALERGRQDLARQRWVAILATNPPPEVADVLRRQLAMLGDSPEGGGLTGGQASAAGAAPGVATASADSAVQLRVVLADDVAASALRPNASLFIFARSGAGGPPVAVIRRSADSLPGEFVLTDADTMLQGNSLSNFAELEIVARLSASGQPLEQSGDIYGRATFVRERDQGHFIDIIMDSIVP